MTTPEFSQQPDILAAYHAIDDAIPVGRIPLAICRQIREEAGDPEQLTPNQRYEYAWVGLEEVLAMSHTLDPDTGRKFSPKRQNIATAAVKAEFQALFDDTMLPLALRTKAGIALVSTDIQHEVNTAKKSDKVSPSYKQYLAGLQKAARELAEQGANNQEERALIDEITSLVVLGEYVSRAGWFTPAAPRQSWQINGFTRISMAHGRMVIADKKPNEHTIAIRRDSLGDHLWDGDGTSGHSSTLRNYMQQYPGFGAKKISPGSTEAHQIFDGIYRRHANDLNEQSGIKAPSYEEALGALAIGGLQLLTSPGEAAKPAKDFAEIDWFVAQASHDLDALQPATLAAHITTLEQAQACGELKPAQLHTLGWMQTDLARIRAQELLKLRARIADIRARAKTADRKARGAMSAAANTLQKNASESKTATLELFDKAEATMQTALELPARISNQLEIQVDAGAIPVYKAHAMDAEQTVIADSLDRYLRYLADLQPQLRDAERQARQNPDEQIKIQVAAIRATIVMLIGGSSDEAARHLALPASVRHGGKHGEVEAVVFPYSFDTDGYERDSPVVLRIGSDDSLLIEQGFVELGVDLLGSKGNRLGLLEKLARVVANAPGKYARVRRRGASIDALTLRISDAIADASEM